MPPRDIPLDATLDDIADELDEDDGMNDDERVEVLGLMASLPMSSPETRRMLALMKGPSGNPA